MTVRQQGRTASARRRATSADPYGDLIRSDAPIAWWRGNGSTADEIAGGTAGTLVGATYGTGILPVRPSAQSFSLDGVDDYVTYPHQAKFIFAGAFTMEAWFIADTVQAGYHQVLSKDSAFWIGLSDGKPLAGAYVGGGAFAEAFTSSAAVITPGVLYHLVGRYSGSAIRVSLDAVEIDTSPLSGTPDSNTNPVRVGVYGTAQAFDGRVVEAALYASQLSDARVSAHNTAGRAA